MEDYRREVTLLISGYFMRDIAVSGVDLFCDESLRSNIRTRRTILAMAQLETNKDLIFILSPFNHRRSDYVLSILHLYRLNHPLIYLQSFIYLSRNDLAIELTRLIQLPKAFQREWDQFLLVFDWIRAGGLAQWNYSEQK